MVITLSPYESWLNLPNEWTEQGLNLALCNERLDLEITRESFISNTNNVLIALSPEGCYSNFIIHNEIGAQKIILNLQDTQLKLLQNLEILGQSTSLTVINNKDAFFTNIITHNVKELTYISGSYNGLNCTTGSILYNKVQASLYINSIISNKLSISSSKIILAGEINLSSQLIIKINGSDNKNYNLDTQQLNVLNTIGLKISDYSKSGKGINLQGYIVGFDDFQVDGNDFLANGTLVSRRLSFAFKGNSEIYGQVYAADIIISSIGNLELKQNSELRKVSFKGYEVMYPAPIKLRTKSNFICKENGLIFSDGRIIIQAGKNLFYQGRADAKDDIKFEGEAIYKEVGASADIITHFGNIIFNNGTIKPGNLVIKGIVLAKQGFIKYIIGENFRTDGINAGIMGIFITQIAPNASNIEINKVDESINKRWQETIISNAQIVASFISFANNIIIEADKITLNDGAIILNLADLSLGITEAGEVIIRADSYIYQIGSNITATAAVIEETYGKNNEDLGLVFINNAHIESRFGEINITSLQSIKFEGNLTGGTSVYIKATCLQNSRESVIHSLQGNVKIDLSKCHFNHFGGMYSNSTLELRVEGGDIENHNVIAGDDIKITGDKNFINHGRIISNNNARIGLGVNDQIILKPGSLMYVGSYDLGHFSDMYRVRIGLVDCHGCSITTIKPVTSIISADILSLRITHYEKTGYHQIGQGTFRVEEWKQRHYDLGICTRVSHHWRDATLTLYENHHNYYGPAQASHTGNLVLDVGLISIVMSSLTGEGDLQVVGNSIVKTISEQTDKRLEVSQNDITPMNSQDKVKNNFGMVTADVTIQGRNIVFTQPKDSVNSVFAFTGGISGNFLKIEIGSAKSYVGNGNYVLPDAHSSAIDIKIMADITANSASKAKSIIVYNWKTRTEELEIITLECLQTYGFDISKLIHPSILNSKVFDHITADQLHRIETSNNRDILNVQPIFFWKDDPFLAPFINEPLNLVHFLTSLAFNQKGLVYTIGDGYFIAKLVDEAVFTLLGVLIGIDNTMLLQSLAVNAISEQPMQKLVAGDPLTPAQIQGLTSSIIWPVWLDNCIQDIKCLDFKLYFNDEALKNSLSGAVMFSEGNIDLKVLGDVLIGLTGQIKSNKAIKFDTQGNFVNIGTLTSIDGIDISAKKNIGNAGTINVKAGDLKLDAAYDIVNLGSSIVQEGNIHLRAGHDIKELILINSASPVPQLTKRAIYAVGGNLYYEAEHDIIQQATAIFASGNITMTAGHDIQMKTIHEPRVVKEEKSRKHYLIQSTIDQYDAVIVVEGSIVMNAGNNFVGSGIQLSSSTGDISILAENEVMLADRTGYAWNYQGATKSKFLGESKVSVSWTTDQTAKLEITAPGGKIYISSKDCTLEGGILSGQKQIFKCDKLEIKPHQVIKKVETVSSQSGLFKPSVPLIDALQNSNTEKHFRDHTIAGLFNSLIKTQGPLDLLPAVNLISSIPRFKADYQLLKGAGAPSAAAIVGALLSKYISASISFGNQETTTSVTQTTSILPQVTGNECELNCMDGYIAANINCQNYIRIECDNLKLAGAKNTLQVTSETESDSFDVGTSLSGVSFGVSFSQGNFQQDQVVHNSGTISSQNILIKVNSKLEIENAQINGKSVTVEALSLEIKQVIDSSRSSSESSGGSFGITVGWAGGVMPYLSAEYAESLKQSQAVHLISGISGESVEVTAKNLAYNIISITAEKYLSILADNIDYIALPQTENIDTEFQAAASVSPRSDGKSTYSASLYSRDGNKVVSVGYSTAFAEGLKDAKEFLINGDNAKSVEQKLESQSSQNPDEQSINEENQVENAPLVEEENLRNERDLAIQNQLESDLRKEYGDQIVDAAKTKFDVDLANRPDDSYIVNNNEIEIELPRNNVMLASNGNILSDAGPATDMSSLKLKLQIISKEEAISYGKNALKIGKYFVRIHPLVSAALNAYALADYLYENKDTIQEQLRLKSDTVSFVETNIVSAKEKVSSRKETKDSSSIKVTSPVMPDPDKEPNKFKEWIKQFEKYLKKDGSNRYDCPKQESPQWNQYENHGRTGLKTNGLRGNKKEFYRWDDLHNDYEVYDDKGRYLGSRDPISGITYRPGTGKVIERIKELIR